MVERSSTSHQDYPALAKERARRRVAAALPAAIAAPRPYGRPRGSRYAALTAPAPAPEQPALARDHHEATRPEEVRRSRRRAPDAPDTVQTLPISLRDELARVRDGQAKRHRHRRFSLGRPKRPVRTAILSTGALLVLLLGVFVGPMVYRATVAYDKIFEEQVPHNDSPFVVAVNPDGSRSIVTPTPAAGADDGESAPAVIPEWDGKERLTILLLGVDRREDEASRSDTMILVNIDPVTKRAAMLSIPRDLKVIIPGYGVHKINAAYAFGDADQVPGGGPGLTIRTIEANFGITVHHYAQVDFDGFVKIIDTLGGLTIDVPYPIKDDEYPGPGNQYMRIYFQAGWQHMDGERVLQYARTRHDDGDGRRSARQQQVLLSLRDQAVGLDLLSKAPDLIADLGDAVRTDLDVGRALQLARLGTEIDPASIVTYSLDDALYEELLPDQPYFLVADWDAVGGILTEFTGEEVLPPMSALANPDYEVEILIEDGTFNPGLGDRVAQVLHANGFQNVTVVEKPDLGNYPISSVAAAPADLTTAFLVASVLGLDPAAITVPDSGAATTTARATKTGNEARPTPTASPPAGTDAASPDGEIAAVPLFPTPEASTSAGDGASGRIVIVLGDDAPDPAYFTAEPFVDEPLPDHGGLEESIQGGGDETGVIEDEEIPIEE